jgi:SAM-dependent methyltransferase
VCQAPHLVVRGSFFNLKQRSIMNVDSIQQYWNNRALEQPHAATTNDVWLRQLEFHTLVQALKRSQISPVTALDIGCGDGLTTIKLAKEFPLIQFTGWDYAPEMIKLARANASYHNITNVHFRVQDFTECPKEYFDVVLSCRVIINIPGWDAQRIALSTAISLGKSFLAIENFQNEQRNFERARELNNLPVIKVHAFNTYLQDHELIRLAFNLDAPVTIQNFANAYYYATRIVYSKVCALMGVEPDYKSPYHEAAAALSELSYPAIAPMKLISM